MRRPQKGIDRSHPTLGLCDGVTVPVELTQRISGMYKGNDNLHMAHVLSRHVDLVYEMVLTYPRPSKSYRLKTRASSNAQHFFACVDTGSQNLISWSNHHGGLNTVLLLWVACDHGLCLSRSRRHGILRQHLCSQKHVRPSTPSIPVSDRGRRGGMTLADTSYAIEIKQTPYLV